MPEPVKIAAIIVVAILFTPGAIVWLFSAAWCLTLGHIGRIICDSGEGT